MARVSVAPTPFSSAPGRQGCVSHCSIPRPSSVPVNTEGSRKCLFLNDQVKQGHACPKGKTKASPWAKPVVSFSVNLPQLAACMCGIAGRQAQDFVLGPFARVCFPPLFLSFSPCYSTPLWQPWACCLYLWICFSFVYFFRVFCLVRFRI